MCDRRPLSERRATLESLLGRSGRRRTQTAGVLRVSPKVAQPRGTSSRRCAQDSRASRRRRTDDEAARLAVRRRPQARRLVEMEDRAVHRRRGADLRAAWQRQTREPADRLHVRRLARRRAGAVRQGLFRVVERRDRRSSIAGSAGTPASVSARSATSSRSRSSSSGSRGSPDRPGTDPAWRCGFRGCCAGARTSPRPRRTRSKPSRNCWIDLPLHDCSIPPDQAQKRPEQREQEPHPGIQSVRCCQTHIALPSVSHRPSSGSRYSVGVPVGVVPVSVCWRSAAAPISPPIPIDSTALLGMSISAPFSFNPS